MKPESGEAFVRVFEKLYGVSCCGAKREERNSLFIDFGKPRLSMREIKAPHITPDPIVTESSKLAIYVRGDWRLILHSDDWKITSKKGRILLHSSSAEARPAAKYLSGDSLKDFSVDVKNKASIFQFESGTRLISRPDAHTALQWSLHEPWHTTLALRKDLNYSYFADDSVERLRRWQKVS